MNGFYSMTNWFKTAQRLLNLLFLTLIVLTAAHANEKPINKRIKQLEQQYQTLSSTFYKDKSSYTDESRKKITDIDQLLNSINNLTESNKPVTAIQLIYFNLDTITENIDTKAVFEIIQMLLDNNEWYMAGSLFKEIRNDGDKSLLATVQFIFAKYHAQRNEWSRVIKLLNGNFSELSEDNAAYAYLLNGSALQHLKKHRQAIDSYSKIKSSSPYYSYAQLNTAIANIRQGWWTDAQTKIRERLKASNKTNQDELTNRLYLVLGYALLQREYYRDSRDAFRHIGLNSRYTNRALLGIGLTATSQGDYIGGLNALTILKDKKTFDLSVDESYLLVPYVYEKLQQEITVTTSYTEAMNYYQRRISFLDNISTQHLNFSNLKYNRETASLIIQNNSFNYNNRFPESFIKNYTQLNEFKKLTKKT